MEGPTPVSALLHSCTLVMAGLFTLLRMHSGLTKSALFVCFGKLIANAEHASLSSPDFRATTSALQF